MYAKRAGAGHFTALERPPVLPPSVLDHLLEANGLDSSSGDAVTRSHPLEAALEGTRFEPVVPRDATVVSKTASCSLLLILREVKVAMEIPKLARTPASPAVLKVRIRFPPAANQRRTLEDEARTEPEPQANSQDHSRCRPEPTVPSSSLQRRFALMLQAASTTAPARRITRWRFSTVLPP